MANNNNGKNGKRKSKPLINHDAQLHSLKKVLDRILLESDSLPGEIRQHIVSARDAAWDIIKAEEETVNLQTR